MQSTKYEVQKKRWRMRKCEVNGKKQRYEVLLKERWRWCAEEYRMDRLNEWKSGRERAGLKGGYFLEGIEACGQRLAGLRSNHRVDEAEGTYRMTSVRFGPSIFAEVGPKGQQEVALHGDGG